VRVNERHSLIKSLHEAEQKWEEEQKEEAWGWDLTSGVAIFSRDSVHDFTAFYQTRSNFKLLIGSVSHQACLQTLLMDKNSGHLINTSSFFFFWRYWGLDLGSHTCRAIILPLELCHQIFFSFSYFLDNILRFCPSQQLPMLLTKLGLKK
jgi:hypothetical protein